MRIPTIVVEVERIIVTIAGAVIVIVDNNNNTDRATIAMTAPVILTSIVSTSTTCSGIFSIIAKKISTCTNDKLCEYIIKLHTATAAYSKLTSCVSFYLSDGKISDEEFATIMKTYVEAFRIASDFSKINQNEKMDN